MLGETDVDVDVDTDVDIDVDVDSDVDENVNVDANVDIDVDVDDEKAVVVKLLMVDKEWVELDVKWVVAAEADVVALWGGAACAALTFALAWVGMEKLILRSINAFRRLFLRRRSILLIWSRLMAIDGQVFFASAIWLATIP